MLVRTCHRVELYVARHAFDGGELPQLPAHGVRLDGPDAARHLIRLTCGLESAVLGEDQVLHQIRDTYATRRAAQPLDPVLDRLFQVALNAGRRAHGWFAGAHRSLGDAALDVIEQHVGTLRDQPLLLVGAGSMGRLTAKAAARRGAQVIITNRTAERAASLARDVGGRSFACVVDGTLPRVVGAVVALSSGWQAHPLDAQQMVDSGATVVDLSSPPAVSPSMQAQLGDRFVSIDDLAWGLSVELPVGLRERLEQLVTGSGGEYCRWLRARGSLPAIQALTAAAEGRRLSELQWLVRRLPNLSEQDQAVIDQMSHRLVAGILHAPRSALRLDDSGDLDRAARELFGLEQLQPRPNRVTPHDGPETTMEAPMYNRPTAPAPTGGGTTTATHHPRGHLGGQPTPVGSVKAEGYVYSRAPMLVYWETTLACGLACTHCRATAMPDPGPNELSTQEGLDLLDKIQGFGEPYPHIVFTGGDPLRRADLQTLIEAAAERGIGASLAPAATPELTRERMATLQECGIQAISLSIDGSNAERHDTFRGVQGTFDYTVKAAGWAKELGLPVQVNTLVTAETLPDLPAVYELMLGLGIMRWSLFYLITVGRGSGMTEVSPGDSERLNHWLFDLSKTSPFAIKTTEATPYRRGAVRAMEHDGMSVEAIAASSVGRGFGIRDGNGIIFISHDGSVNPSGFLPINTGNVRTDDIVTLYREHPVFVSLRDVSAYKGRCGRCQYAVTCGGSRARAFARTGDYLESDPLCPFVPHVSAMP